VGAPSLKPSPSTPLGPRAWVAAALVLLAACQVAPPAQRVEGPAGAVRAASLARAEEVAGFLAELQPLVLAALPGARERSLEVWVQESPRLYRFAASGYSEADGFWAAGQGRIHLREGADSLQRTLAHEIVHADLDGPWQLLPGTVEEGLCDWVSALVCPEAAPRMRAGRLIAACFATGGMELGLDVVVPREVHRLGIDVGFSAEIVLHGGTPLALDPAQVFDVRAGLSSTTLSPEHKRAFYGLAYLLVDRIARRVGLEGLYGLCRRARAEGREEVPAEWLLAAADLHGTGREEWRAAVHAALGSEELEQLLRMYPDLVADTLQRIFRSRREELSGDPVAATFHARMGLRGAPEHVALNVVLR